MLLTLALSLGMQVLATNPITQVLTMISDLEGKIITEGKTEQKLYDKKTRFCEERASKLSQEIKTEKAEIDDLEATTDEQTAIKTVASTKIEEESSDISTDEADLKAAIAILETETADFKAEERQSKEIIDSLDRGIATLTKEMAKSGGGSSMLQMKSSKGLTEALTALVQGAAMSADDASKLTSLVQSNADMADSDEDGFGAPAAAATEGHSAGIIGVLEGLSDKAEGQLTKARSAQADSLNNYKMLKQSLINEMKALAKDLSADKKKVAAAQEKKSVATGDLDATSKDEAGDIKSKSALQHECMAAAQEFELSVKARTEELTTIATAKKVINEASGGAEKQTYGFDQESAESPDSFIQAVSQSSTNKAMRLIRELAQTQHSAGLAQLASRMTAAVRMSADPFGKVKSMINDMLKKLEGDESSEASQKAYCDKELAETASKKDEKTTQLESLTTKVSQKKSASAKLQNQVATLQKELAAMSSAIAKATQLRQEEKEAYNQSKAELHRGLQGIQMGLKVLRTYFAKSKDDDGKDGSAGGNIIGLLEVIESDLTKGLVEANSEEDSASRQYEEFADANKFESLAKTQDQKYKTKEFKSLDKAGSELSGDLAGVSEENDAIVEYDAKIKQACIGKALPYEEKQKRREAEIEGLQEALTTLEPEAVLIQTSSKKSMRKVTLRGAK